MQVLQVQDSLCVFWGGEVSSCCAGDACRRGPAGPSPERCPAERHFFLRTLLRLSPTLRRGEEDGARSIRSKERISSFPEGQTSLLEMGCLIMRPGPDAVQFPPPPSHDEPAEDPPRHDRRHGHCRRDGMTRRTASLLRACRRKRSRPCAGGVHCRSADPSDRGRAGWGVSRSRCPPRRCR